MTIDDNETPKDLVGLNKILKYWEKRLLEEIPFENNIILSLVILVISLGILIIFTLFREPIQNK